MAVDGLAKQGARASAAMVLTEFSLEYSGLSTNKVNSLLPGTHTHCILTLCPLGPTPTEC